jgi:hypothetical protein
MMPPSCGLYFSSPSILSDGAAEGGWLHIIRNQRFQITGIENTRLTGFNKCYGIDQQ